MAKDEELIGNQAAADYVDLSVDTWRPYVKRRIAPQPHRREIRGGHALPVWRKSVLEHWRDNRRGQGRRTDLEREAEDR